MVTFLLGMGQTVHSPTTTRDEFGLLEAGQSGSGSDARRTVDPLMRDYLGHLDYLVRDGQLVLDQCASEASTRLRRSGPDAACGGAGLGRDCVRPDRPHSWGGTGET